MTGTKPISASFSLAYLIFVLSAPSSAFPQSVTRTSSPSLQLHAIDPQTPQGLRNLFQYTGDTLPIVSAHRGGAQEGFPENCIATFQKTLQHTFAILEIDPRYTKDGAIVVHHDSTLERTTTGEGRVADWTLEELKTLRLKDLDGEVTEFQIPTIDEVLEWARGKTVLVLDQKDVPVEARVRKIEEHRAEAFAMLIVYSYKDARKCYELNKDIMMEVMIPNREKFDEFEKTGVSWSNIVAFVGHTPPENPELMEMIHAKETCCIAGTSRNLDRALSKAGTVDNEAIKGAYRDLLQNGIDLIETDLPVEVGRVLYPEPAIPASKSSFFRLWQTTSAPLSDRGKVAPKPLYRDPVYDGAADPVLIWNHAREKWWMLYTNRRANVPGLRGVSWVHGTRIGIAESEDAGASWKYRGTAQINLGGEDDSHWAPDVLFHNDRYHMFLSFVPGMHEDWNGTRYIHHLTSEDLIRWKDQGRLPLTSDRVIDASVLQMDDGTWRMWYNNESDRKAIYLANSPDMYQWTDRGKVIGDKAGEGPKVFRWHGYYWMIVDQWQGLGVYRSEDADSWQRQTHNLLVEPGQGQDDRVKGGHADVVVSGNRAFLLYFTHPGRHGPDAEKDGYDQRRSSIQVVELEFTDGWLNCDRDEPTHIHLQSPK